MRRKPGNSDEERRDLLAELEAFAEPRALLVRALIHLMRATPDAASAEPTDTHTEEQGKD